VLAVFEVPAAAEILGVMAGCKPDLSSLLMKVIFLVQFMKRYVIVFYLLKLILNVFFF
jgi:hypothetical protein